MKYLISGGGPELLGSCFIWPGDCICNNDSTYNPTCGLRYDQDNACPDHCWANVCTRADVDPFSVVG